MPAEISIRVARPGDAAAVEKVLLASYPALMAGAYDAVVLARALPGMTRANPGLLASGTYYLAEAAGEAVGCGGWTLERPGTVEVEPGLAHIRHFGVDPGWTGRGVGRALYERCQAQARAAGARRFECYASLNGEAFYAAMGFTSAGPIDVPMGPNLTFPSIRMFRPIRDAAMFHIAPGDLNDPRVTDLLRVHLLTARAETAPGSAHALDLSGLRSPDITLWTIWEGETLAGVGALKRLSADHGEVKSMHTAQAMRGRGTGRAMLAHIVAAAQGTGMSLSLETGAWDFFRPAHALYRSHGFTDCPPFGDYRPDPNSLFMTLDLRR